MTDSFDIGLGRNDDAVRREADDNYVDFWGRQAGRLRWFEPWTKTLEWNAPFARWFSGGLINASYNALDVHEPSRTAILWEGEDGDSRTVTYGQLLEDVQKLASALASLGVKAGDRVVIYLPMIPELTVSMLACARIGAVHAVVFSGFSASSLGDRIADSGARVVITADVGYRRGSTVRLKETVDEAIGDAGTVDCVVVLERTGSPAVSKPRDISWKDMMAGASSDCPAAPLPSDHPLFILYTSGTTGKPKGVLHGTGGYLTHVHSTFGWAFDIQDSDVFFCTADIGWVTGHSYVVYGPLMHGATLVMYEGAPDYPDPSRMWKIIARYDVTIFYTTPTALRMFVKFGDDIPNSHDLSSVRLLGTVGEPINPETWKWYYNVIGKGRCPIIDTWWQTETGGMMISALPGIETVPLKPGSATRPIPGVSLGVVDADGADVPDGTKGHLVIKQPWPGMLLTLWQDDDRYGEAYWSRFPGWYYTGDYAIRDSDGYMWLLGRSDDILKVAGHRIGTAELESSIVSHPDVAEAAVCGIPDDIKGEVIVAFAVLRQGVNADKPTLRPEIVSTVRKSIGPIATPEWIYFVPRLPKTRSGKIMRRLLKRLLLNEETGNIATIEDASVVGELADILGSSSPRPSP